MSIPESVQLPPPQPSSHQLSHGYQIGAIPYNQNQIQDPNTQSGSGWSDSVWEPKSEGYLAAYPSPSQLAYAEPETQYRERTASTMTIRSAYRGSFSAPATNSSPPEGHVPQNARPNEHTPRRDSHYTMLSTDFKRTNRPEQQSQGLPPLSSLAEPRPQLPTPRPEGAISPRTVACSHQQGNRSGYLPPSSPRTSHHSYYRHSSQQENYSGPPVLPPPHGRNASHNVRSSEVLMRFADVAVEQRDADGRRGLDSSGARAERRESVSRRDSGNKDGKCYQQMSIGARIGFNIE